MASMRGLTFPGAWAFSPALPYLPETFLAARSRPTLSSSSSRSASNKVKKNWATKYKPVGPSHLAIEYMDAHYPRLYGPKDWMMIRCAMLSQQKYAMLFNSYMPDTNRCWAVALENGATEILGETRRVLNEMRTGTYRRRVATEVPPFRTEEDAQFEADDEYQRQRQEEHHPQPVYDDGVNPDESLDFFLPPKKIYYRHGNIDLHADMDEAKEAEMYEARKRPHRVVVEETFGRASATFDEDGQPIVGGDQVVEKMDACIDDIPPNLQVAISPKGHVETYPQPFHQFDRLGYYLLDAASILPVLALDVKEDDVVGDLCAAPGGKTLALLFTKRPKYVVATDKSFARIRRFQEVMFSYLPKDIILRDSPENRLQFMIRDAHTWRPDDFLFDKVLVDVPCTNDRLSVNNDFDNIFAPGKVREREYLPEYQALLLQNAYGMVKPGGYVVYSTCSLSPSQNDGVIRRFFEQHKKSNPHQPQPVVSNLTTLTTLFGIHFNFFKGCNYGIQVIPTLKANFGPMYICRIRKPENTVREV